MKRGKLRKEKNLEGMLRRGIAKDLLAAKMILNQFFNAKHEDALLEIRNVF